MNAFYDSNVVLIQATFVGILLALSVQVALRMGVFSFAGAGSYGIGAYAAANLVLRNDLPALPTLVLSGLVAAAIGLVLGLVIYRLNGLYLAMATVAFDLTVGVIAVNGGEWTGGANGLFGVLTDLTLPIILVVVIACVVGVAVTEHGRTGRRIDAVREDPELAASMGINVRRYRLFAFVGSGFLGGVAGAMNVLARTTIGPADVGFGLVILALTMIIVGGALSWKGAVIGAVLFTWLPELLSFVGEWQELVYGCIVLLAGIFLPQGLHGLYVDGRRRIAASRRRSRLARVERRMAGEASEPGEVGTVERVGS
jgi:branched-chain amino acid transport system permease protein